MFMTRSLLAVLADPSVTYLLFVLGIIGVAGEVHHPGTLLPGIAGGLALVLALVGFSELGINWIGLGLLLLAAALFVAEAHRPDSACSRWRASSPSSWGRGFCSRHSRACCACRRVGRVAQSVPGSSPSAQSR
jgi:hypothetical protein